VRTAARVRGCYTAPAVNPMRRHLRPATWLALLAVWALALLPTVSHALAAQRGDAWVEVCTTQGLQRVELAAAADDGEAPQQPAGLATGHRDHCPLCQAAQAALLPPAAPDPFGRPMAGAARVAAPVVAALRAEPLWSPALARAPPTIA